jgi:hypothetical protein
MNALTHAQNDNHGPSLARIKLEELVARGRLQAATVIGRIMAERPNDYLIPARALGFHVDADTGVVYAAVPGFDQPLHAHALRQVAAKVGLPATYLDRLLDRGNRTWGPSLLLGLLPTKGLPLPFVSYGGTALVMSLFMASVLVKISARAPEPSRMTLWQSLRTVRARFKNRRNATADVQVVVEVR